MKKVLAAVLAVAMAASMSAVAFATDYEPSDENGYTGASGQTHGSTRDDLKIGKEYKYDVSVNDVTLRDDLNHSFSTEDLQNLVDTNKLSASVIITSGKEKFDSVPTLKTVGDTVQLKLKFKDTYDTKEVSGKVKPRFTAKKDIYDSIRVIVKDATGDWHGVDSTGTPVGTAHASKSDAYDDADAMLISGILASNPWDKDAAKNAAKNVYGVVGAGYTAYDFDETNLILKKGDTVTCPELELKANYFQIDNYSDSVTVTPTEVDDRNVLAKGEDLYDNSGSSDKVTIYFGSTGDVASVEFKVSSAQKDLNLFYKTDEIEDVTDAYPDVDFEFITFYAQNSGANVLTNSGTMTFNAIGGKNTAVYEWNGKTLTELNSKYDSVDDTVDVDGIKRLTTFVVAEKKLEAKVEETEAPATETQAPVTEPVTAPEPSAPSTDNNENPNTGAL